MWLRKNKDQAEQGRARQPRLDGPTPPAFSYYNNRPTDTTRRVAGRQPSDVRPGEGRRLPRLSLMQLPFWLLMIVAIVCLVKLLALSTDPKVVVLGTDDTTSVYGRPAAVYAQAASHQLSSSLANHSKLTVDTQATARALESKFPELQTASVTLPLIGNRPIVYVQVAQPSVILQTGNGNYALNAQGLALAKLRHLPTHVPLAVDQTGAVPQVGHRSLPGSTVTFMQAVEYQFGAAKIPITNFILPANKPYELDVRLDTHPYIIKYNLQADALQQSGAAIAVVQQFGSRPHSYIDVRATGRAYYK